MLEKQGVIEKLEGLFEENFVEAVSIHESNGKALLLVDLKREYALVTVADFTHLPIGDIDLFVEKRVKKSGNGLYDMAKMIGFLRQDTDKHMYKFQQRVMELSYELLKESKEIAANSVLLNK